MHPSALGPRGASAPTRRRLDTELVRRGLFPSREQARHAIDAGVITVAGAGATKPARLVGADEAIVLLEPAARFVSRGGEKLAAALEQFSIDVAGRRVLDVGASTGGFTDCLLQAGAASVVAVDVGRNQLHERLRTDPRVDSRERTDIRGFTVDQAGGAFPLVVADLAFISLRSVVDALLALAAPGADVVLLVKPQYEAGRVEASRGRGIIRDPTIWRRVLGDVTAALTGQGAAIMGAMVSPLRGTGGNVEFLLHASAPDERGSVAASHVDLDSVVATASEACEG